MISLASAAARALARVFSHPKTGGNDPRFAGMKLLCGGEFAMGCNDEYADEAPVRRVAVGDFWIDETPVTNAQFARFVAQTGYVTFAEMAPNPADYPGAHAEDLVAGSAVFTPASAPVVLADFNWWSYRDGACWRAPLGAGSDLTGLDEHPVVHVVHSDAAAYAAWAGKSLPTEAEWEYAARGGLDGARYAWGDTFTPGGVRMANTWEGEFPWRNDAPEGQKRTSAVRSFPLNGYGLADMIGNTWEWTDDWYVAQRPAPDCCGKGLRPPTAEESLDAVGSPRIPRKVLKGGSHLCAESYCRRFRPAARWPQPIDTSTSNVGFRCVVRR